MEVSKSKRGRGIRSHNHSVMRRLFKPVSHLHDPKTSQSIRLREKEGTTYHRGCIYVSNPAIPGLILIFNCWLKIETKIFLREPATLIFFVFSSLEERSKRKRTLGFRRNLSKELRIRNHHKYKF